MKTTQYVRQEKAVAAADSTTLLAEIAAYDAALDAEARQYLLSIELGHLYVIEFASGVVKVGKTNDPGGRLAQHARLARAHGGDVRASWMSRQHLHSGESERHLIAFCSHAGKPVAGREYFRIPYADAVGRASLLSSNYVSPGDMGSEWCEQYETACRELGMDPRLRAVAA